MVQEEMFGTEEEIKGLMKFNKDSDEDDEEVFLFVSPCMFFLCLSQSCLLYSRPFCWAEYLLQLHSLFSSTWKATMWKRDNATEVQRGLVSTSLQNR